MSVNSDNLGGMDQQHKLLGELVKAACNALKNGRGSDELSGVLIRLLGFTRIHFSQEEDLMRLYGYEGLESHTQAHKRLFDRLAELTGETFNNFRETTKGRLLSFLEQDLRYHIVEDTHAWEVGQLEKRLAYQRLYDHEAQLES